ncbi:MAG: endonuclease/exonuclease/phosphatase family protein [Fibrobacter sp.]|nr:endonuclease/exonuclease/phosphatase family protein [Fibrobacter sp.]
MISRIKKTNIGTSRVADHGLRLINHLLLTAFFLLLVSCKGKFSEIETSAATIKAPSTAVAAYRTDTFTVAFYNVENLFDTRFEGTEYPEYNPAVSNWDKNMAPKKVSAVADVIAAMRPDIIGLCEVESYHSLMQLKKSLKNKGLDYKYSVIGDQPVKTSTCTALLSKYPVKKVLMHEVRMNNGKTSRNIIESDITFNATTFKVFVNHWPSKMNPEKDRTIAAQVLKRRLDSIGTSSECIITGDFNINYDEYRYSTKSGKNSLQINGLNHILGTVTEVSGSVRHITEQDMISKAKGYYDLWLELPESDRMSEVYKGYYQTLDHILIDRLLFDSKGISYVDNSYHVFTWDNRLLRGNIPFRWEIKRQNNRIHHTANGYSDHLPVMASFTCKPFTDKDELYKNDKPGKVSFDADNSGTSRVRPTRISKHWTLCTTAASLTEKRDEGRTFIHLGHKSGSRNISIARKSVTITEPAIPLRLRGSGRISIRVRQASSDWIYFNGPMMNKGMKSAHYENATIDKWTTFRLKLPEHYKNTTVEMEIRAGKGYDFSFDLE